MCIRDRIKSYQGYCFLNGIWSGGANIPRCLEAVRQLLAVIKEFLFFRFKGLKCLLFVVFLLLSVIVGQPACSGLRQRNFDLGKWNYRAIPKVKTWSYFLTIP